MKMSKILEIFKFNIYVDTLKCKKQIKTMSKTKTAKLACIGIFAAAPLLIASNLGIHCFYDIMGNRRLTEEEMTGLDPCSTANTTRMDAIRSKQLKTNFPYLHPIL